MGLKETLKSDLTEAIRSSDKVVSGTIRMVLTAITNEEVSGKEARAYFQMTRSSPYSHVKQRSVAKQLKLLKVQAMQKRRH